MKRREIFIELTSLLDVILILLFVLLTQARTQTADALSRAEDSEDRSARLTRQVEELEADNAALRETSELWRRQLLTQDLVLDNSLVMTISAGEAGDIRLDRDGQTVQTIAYDWERDNYARNALRSALRSLLQDAEDQTVFLVFQYDRSVIYRTEYEMIESLLQEAKLEARQRELALSILELDTGTGK